jgi:hypothetical protein
MLTPTLLYILFLSFSHMSTFISPKHNPLFKAIVIQYENLPGDFAVWYKDVPEFVRIFIDADEEVILDFCGFDINGEGHILTNLLGTREQRSELREGLGRRSSIYGTWTRKRPFQGQTCTVFRNRLIKYFDDEIEATQIDECLNSSYNVFMTIPRRAREHVVNQSCASIRKLGLKESKALAIWKLCNIRRQATMVDNHSIISEAKQWVLDHFDFHTQIVVAYRTGRTPSDEKRFRHIAHLLSTYGETIKGALPDIQTYVTRQGQTEVLESPSLTPEDMEEIFLKAILTEWRGRDRIKILPPKFGDIPQAVRPHHLLLGKKQCPTACRHSAMILWRDDSCQSPGASMCPRCSAVVKYNSPAGSPQQSSAREVSFEECINLVWRDTGAFSDDWVGKMLTLQRNKAFATSCENRISTIEE